jgi:hypothetical protein
MPLSNALEEWRRREIEKKHPDELPVIFFHYNEESKSMRFDDMIQNGRHRNMFVANPAVLSRRL